MRGARIVLEKSESIEQIAVALVKFQAEVKPVKKTATNPFYKKKYATLDCIIETIGDPLKKNGLCYSQFPIGDTGLTTILMHTSGEYLMATYEMRPEKNTPQGQGISLTYQRRYALSAVLGIATEDDDDGNGGSGKGNDDNSANAKSKKPPKLSDAKHKKLEALRAEKNVDREKVREEIGKWRNIHPADEEYKDIHLDHLFPKEFDAIIKKLEAAPTKGSE